jgi:hypothetical protein
MLKLVVACERLELADAPPEPERVAVPSGIAWTVAGFVGKHSAVMSHADDQTAGRSSRLAGTTAHAVPDRLGSAAVDRRYRRGRAGLWALNRPQLILLTRSRALPHNFAGATSPS